MLRTPLLVLLAALAALTSFASSPSASSAPSALAQDGQASSAAVAEILAKLKSATDSADPKLIGDLAGHRTRTACEALIEAYNVMVTIFMKREIVRALVQFDGVADAEQPALQKIMDVATEASERELRSAALDALGDCTNHGKDFLAMIVASPAEDSVRVHAMELHVRLGDEGDWPWYRQLYKPPPPDEKALKAEKEKEKKEKKALKKGEEAPPPERKAKSLDEIRRMAFDALVGSLTPDELAEAVHDGDDQIGAAALKDLDRRGEKRTLELATAVFDQLGGGGPYRSHKRVLAAQIMAKISGTKVAPDLHKRAVSVDTSSELQRGLADVMAGFNDPAVNRELINDLASPRPRNKLFALQAVRALKDEKVDKALVKLLADKDQEVVLATLDLLVERQDKTVVPVLQKMVEKGGEKSTEKGEKGKDRTVSRAALEAEAKLREGDPTWVAELTRLTKHEDGQVRSLALQQLGRTSGKEHLEQLLAALSDPDWSARLAALRALEALQMKEVIRPIIDRMPKEEGRMLEELWQALFRLTGQPYGDNIAGWDSWWKQAEASFKIVTPEELKKIEEAEEEWRLKQTTRVDRPSKAEAKSTPDAKFFGIKIVSHRVIFIIDVSGSMTETLEQPYEGEANAERMTVAKTSLQKCIAGLEPTAFFNIITFSSDVNRWVDGSLAAANPKNREAALTYVGELLPFGGTNLYDAVQEAFRDADVDTIYIMSDGEPSAGGETEPLVIREHIKQWNEHRGIQINTIAIGGQFQILEWLAEDSGGTHVKFE